MQKALSGVARMSRRQAGVWRGRFGRMKIVNMLVGSRSKDILNARLDELTTYGLLKPEGSAYVQSLLRELQKIADELPLPESLEQLVHDFDIRCATVSRTARSAPSAARVPTTPSTGWSARPRRPTWRDSPASTAGRW